MCGTAFPGRPYRTRANTLDGLGSPSHVGASRASGLLSTRDRMQRETYPSRGKAFADLETRLQSYSLQPKV
jgi:hypothetical protein